MSSLRVTKIVDEMIDLETGEQFSHGIVVSNGRREAFIPLARESLEPLVALYAETVPQKQQNGHSEVHTPAAPPVRSIPAGASTPEVSRPRPLPPASKTVVLDQGRGIDFTPAPPAAEPEFEPGEVYRDELGVESL